MKKILFLICMLLTACSTTPKTMPFASLDGLRIGMQHVDAAKLLSAKPCEVMEVNAESKKYDVEVYRVANGLYRSNYFVVYDAAGKLIYWGYPNEFSRSENKLLNLIGAQAISKLK
jgi:hypothetical protein